MKSARHRWFAAALAGLIIVCVSLLWLPGNSPAARQSIEHKTPNAERLVIRYSNGAFELLSRLPLVKTLPPSTLLPAPLGEVRGSWFEVVDHTDATVYRRPIPSPRIQWVEYLDPDGSGQLIREEAVVDKQTFSVVVPLKDDARQLVFYDAVGDGTKRQADAAGETGRVVLR